MTMTAYSIKGFVGSCSTIKEANDFLNYLLTDISDNSN